MKPYLSYQKQNLTIDQNFNFNFLLIRFESVKVMEGNDTIDDDNIFPPTRQRQLEWRSVHGSLPQVEPRPSSLLLKQNTILGLSTPGENDPENSESNIKMKFECAVCFETYSESGSHVPRSLSCGHTFCTGKLLGVRSFAKII